MRTEMQDAPISRELTWLWGNDTGVSSKTIFSVLSAHGAPMPRPGVPRDPADLGRCLRLLAAVPEWQPRLPEVGEVYPEWKPLIREWGRLTALYIEELPSGMAPKCYAAMRELIQEGRQLLQAEA